MSGFPVNRKHKRLLVTIDKDIEERNRFVLLHLSPAPRDSREANLGLASAPTGTRQNPRTDRPREPGGDMRNE